MCKNAINDILTAMRENLPSRKAFLNDLRKRVFKSRNNATTESLRMELQGLEDELERDDRDNHTAEEIQVVADEIRQIIESRTRE